MFRTGERVKLITYDYIKFFPEKSNTYFSSLILGMKSEETYKCHIPVMSKYQLKELYFVHYCTLSEDESTFTKVGGFSSFIKKSAPKFTKCYNAYNDTYVFLPTEILMPYD